MKCDEGLDEALLSVGGRPVPLNHSNEDEELSFSNIEKEDIEVYLRSSMFINKVSRKMM